MWTLEQVEAAGGYDVITADPAWSYNDRGSNGAAEKHYPTMSVEELCALPVHRLAARDSVLFLWACNPLLPEALKVIDAWGYTFKTVAFEWVKTRGDKLHFGLGRWTRGNVEPCLLAVRGKPHRLLQAYDVRQVIHDECPQCCNTTGTLIYCGTCGSGPPEPSSFLVAPVTRHSAKPPEARARIDRMFPQAAKLELFAREKVPGWDAWGNEIMSDVDLSPVS